MSEEQRRETSSGEMSFSKDEFGKEILLKDGSLQVMMEWEKPYMEACINALKPEGDVLEIGFGLGYSASHIQIFSPKSHTIIECNADVTKKAKLWAKERPNVNIIEGTWQEKMGQLGKFDQIFFDDYAPMTKEEVDKVKSETKIFEEQSAENAKKKERILEQLKQFKGVKFSDEQLGLFGIYIEGKANTTHEEVISFINGLVKQENIVKEQADVFLQGYTQKHGIKLEDINSLSTIGRADSPLIGDRLFHFFELCLNNHMALGARISSYIDYYEFKKKEAVFHDFLEKREDVTFKEETISVEVPENCTYYEGNKALVLVIEKKGSA